MTQAETHQATGLGPEWQVIWEGSHALPDVERLCGGLYGLGRKYLTDYLRGLRCTGRGPGPRPCHT
jgi:hypothetical protein